MNNRNTNNYLNELLAAEAEEIRLTSLRAEEKIRLEALQQAEDLRLDAERREHERKQANEEGKAYIRMLQLQYKDVLDSCPKLEMEIENMVGSALENADCKKLSLKVEKALEQISELLSEYNQSSLRNDAIVAEWINARKNSLTLFDCKNLDSEFDAILKVATEKQPKPDKPSPQPSLKYRKALLSFKNSIELITSDLEDSPIGRNIFLTIIGLIVLVFLTCLSFVGTLELKGFFVTLLFLAMTILLAISSLGLAYVLITENLQTPNPKKHLKNLKKAREYISKMPLDLTSNADKLLAQSVFVQLTNFSNSTSIFLKVPYIQISRYASKVLRVNAFNETSTQQKDIEGGYSENLCIGFKDLQNIVLY